MADRGCFGPRRRGRKPRAIELVEEEIERPGGRQRSRAGQALRGRGLLSGRSGIDDLKDAVDVLAASEERLEQIRALVDLGAALRRAGRAPLATPLREALDLAVRGGAHTLAARARTELIASGARPRRDELRGRDALTASERRIALLAAEGRTNREIAQALFVTRARSKLTSRTSTASSPSTGRDALSAAFSSERSWCPHDAGASVPRTLAWP